MHVNEIANHPTNSTLGIQVAKYRAMYIEEAIAYHVIKITPLHTAAHTDSTIVSDFLSFVIRV